MKPIVVARSLGSGAATGLRAMTGPATVLRGSKSGWARILPLLALGEVIVDKLPMMPARTIPRALLTRAAAGAFAGAAVAGWYDENRVAGAILGAAGAIGAAYLGREYRSFAKRRHIPDFVAALLEDGLALGLGVAARG